MKKYIISYSLLIISALIFIKTRPPNPTNPTSNYSQKTPTPEHKSTRNINNNHSSPENLTEQQEKKQIQN